MCGISLVVSKNKVLLSEFVKMNSIIKHRGPDGDGFVGFSKNLNLTHLSSLKFNNSANKKIPYLSFQKNKSISSNIFIGSRRLAISDKSIYGHQPMCDSRKEYWISFNGEIYNYIVLKRKLQLKGYKFYSRSDTEVILYSYIEWGKKCLDYFEGMFSFVIFDIKRKKFFISRDPYGIKPIYYWINKDKSSISFSSEIKQFSVFKSWHAYLNINRAIDYIFSGVTDHTKETLFENVYQLLPGHYCEILIDDILNNNLNVKQKRWFQLGQSKSSKTNKYPADYIKNIINKAINDQTINNLEYSTLLSGGVDSSIINSYLSQVQKDNFDAFSSFPNKENNDYKNTQLLVKKMKIKNIFKIQTFKDFKDNIDKIIYFQDEPFGSLSIFAQYDLMRIIKSYDKKIILDGQGADELFCGYKGFYIAKLIEYLKTINIIGIFRYLKYRNLKLNNKVIDIFKALLIIALPTKFLNKLMSFKLEYNPKMWIENSLIKKKFSHIIFDKGNFSNIKALQTFHIQKTLPMLLHWSDRNSMSFSIEARYPYLNSSLLNYLLNLNSDLKVSKYFILKDILRKTYSLIVPNLIIYRQDKIGFLSNDDLWIRKKYKSYFIKELDKSINNCKGILKNSLFHEIINNYDNKSQISTGFIWRIICFGKWIKIYNVKVQK